MRPEVGLRPEVVQKRPDVVQKRPEVGLRAHL